MNEPKYYWEDFKTGDTLEFGSKRVTQHEIVAYANQFDPQTKHLNDEDGKASILGGHSASGWHTAALLSRMICDGFMLDSSSMGSPGVDEVRWKKPVYVDDVLSVRMTVLGGRPSGSRPEMGLVHMLFEVFNQRTEIVMTLDSWTMFGRRSAVARAAMPDSAESV